MTLSKSKIWIENPRSLTTFGVEVEKALAELRATKRDLAKAIGIKQGYLTEILQGTRKGGPQIEPICKLLGLDVTKFNGEWSLWQKSKKTN